MRQGFSMGLLLLCVIFLFNCGSDSEAPIITITSPANDDTVSIHTVTISAQASDNKEVEYVEFYVNNFLVGTDSAEPYQTGWTIASYDNMEIVSIQGTAYDPAENAGQSDVILVTVMNRGMVSEADTDTAVIFDGTWAVCDVFMDTAPDSAVVDSIVTYVTILHNDIVDVDVYLQSPAGTERQLWNNDFNMPTDTVSTAQFLNEDINGTWLLRIYDEPGDSTGGFATDFNIQIYWKY